MNKQEIFDKVYTELFKQGVPSVDPYGTCLYRGPNGTKCAVGHLIPDELYDEKMNKLGVDSLPDSVLQYIGANSENSFGVLSLLRYLQDVHDMALTVSFALWHEEMQRVAKEYKLEFKFPKELN